MGETVASPQRPAQRMHGAALAFDLAREVDALRHESGWAQRDRNGKTLVHERGLRVVLVALKPRARIAEHDTRAHVTVQPSPLMALSSSHCSPASMTPLPHGLGATVVRIW